LEPKRERDESVADDFGPPATKVVKSMEDEEDTKPATARYYLMYAMSKPSLSPFVVVVVVVSLAKTRRLTKNLYMTFAREHWQLLRNLVWKRKSDSRAEAAALVTETIAVVSRETALAVIEIPTDKYTLIQVEETLNCAKPTEHEPSPR